MAKRVLETAATGAASRLASYFLITLFHCVNVICSAVKMEISQGKSLELWRLRFSCLIRIVTLIFLFRRLALLLLRFPRLKLGLFIAGVAGSMFYSAAAIVAMIYCDSTLVFDLMGIALTITMNVMCLSARILIIWILIIRHFGLVLWGLFLLLTLALLQDMEIRPAYQS